VYLASIASRRKLAWDCASGNGQAAIGLASHFERVIATDASAAQIGAAPPHPGISYGVARAEASGLADRSIDLITVAQALHWLDLDAFYSEVRRVLHPRGVLAAWCYGEHSVDAGGPIDGLVGHFYRSIVGPYWPPERRLIEKGYRTIPFPFIELSPPRFELETVWTLDELLGYLRTWSATNRFREATGIDPVVTLGHELAPLWSPTGEPRRVRWPLALRVGRQGGELPDAA
jgi:SAM-dependent methyltransferase